MRLLRARNVEVLFSAMVQVSFCKWEELCSFVSSAFLYGMYVLREFFRYRFESLGVFFRYQE